MTTKKPKGEKVLILLLKNKMILEYKSKSLERSFTEQNIEKNYNVRAKKIRLRLTELIAAQNLTDIPATPPPRLHSLNGNRSNEFAVDISGNWRICFIAYDSKHNLTTNRAEAYIIKVMEVIDYHDK